MWTHRCAKPQTTAIVQLSEISPSAMDSARSFHIYYTELSKTNKYTGLFKQIQVRT